MSLLSEYESHCLFMLYRNFVVITFLYAFPLYNVLYRVFLLQLCFDLICVLHVCMNADGFYIHSDTQPSTVHYLALTNVHGQQKYAVCLTHFAPHSMSKVTFTCCHY